MAEVVAGVEVEAHPEVVEVSATAVEEVVVAEDLVLAEVEDEDEVATRTSRGLADFEVEAVKENELYYGVEVFRPLRLGRNDITLQTP